MKLFIFLDEVFCKSKSRERFISKSNSGTFLLFLNKKFDMTFCFPAIEEQNIKVATTLPSNIKVLPLYGWQSLLGYLKKFISNYYKIKRLTTNSIAECDVVWVRLPSLPGLLIAQIAIKCNKRIVLHIAGDITAAYDNPKFGFIKKILAYFMGLYMHYKTKEIISKSKDIRVLCTGCNLEKLYPHPTTKFFIDSEFSAKPAKNNNGPTYTFLYVGRLLESKGVLDLLTAWEKASLNHAQLLIVGHGELTSSVSNFCKRTLSARFLGHLVGDELKHIYEQADCLVLPSVSSEGFPRVIAEAWCYGLMVIASDVGGIKSVGKHGQNILFFEAGNVQSLCEYMLSVAQDIALHQKLVKGAFSAAQIVSKENMLKIAEDAISKVV